MTLSIVILAAGQGKRMHSQTPKVLHPLAGKPLLEHVIDTALKLAATQIIVVYGHHGELVKNTLAHLPVKWVEQKEQLGTGHAVQQALPLIPNDDRVLILSGDVPLISADTLKKFIANTPKDALGMMTANLPDPADLGRIIRDEKNKIVRIVEEKDATDIERNITEINTGIYLISAHHLQMWLPKLTNQNAQKEYYLTDVIHAAVKNIIPLHSEQPHYYQETLGINDRAQLAILERFYQKQLAEKYMRQGVTLMDPDRFDIRGELITGTDVVIDINVIIEGRVKIGSHSTIGPNVVLRNVTLGDHVEVKANSVLDGVEIHNHAIIGPFARLRPGTVLAAKTHVGNFVEIKNSVIDMGSKINHLSYIGDSEIGKQVNVGAGTITCNYDGVNKNKTTIHDNAFIGSNTALIAPVTIGAGATIGAGSIISRDAPAQQLTLSRAKQTTIENWKSQKEKT